METGRNVMHYALGDKGKCVFRFESCRGKIDRSYIRGGRIESTIKPPSTK